MSDFRTLDHVDVKGKRVLVRVDLNVPVDHGVVTDATRIERMAPAITEIAAKGGKVILLSHFGRPKGRDAKNSLKPVAAEVARIIKRPVKFVDDCIGEVAERAVAAMKQGEIVCLENTRFYPGEEKNDPTFVASLAKLGDIWVNDAFSAAHRAHASTEGLGHLLPAYAGRTLQAELEAFEKVLDKPQRPLAAIVGGAKISTKLDLLGHLLQKVDVLIIGGAMANTFAGAGQKWANPGRAEFEAAQKIRRGGRQAEIWLPVDAPWWRKNRSHAPSRGRHGQIGARHDPDIGPRSSSSHLRAGAPRRWCGTAFGAFGGTVRQRHRRVAEAAAERRGGRLITVGGGDTVAALNAAGVTDRFTYVSTAGGAFLEWLEGKPCPGSRCCDKICRICPGAGRMEEDNESRD